MKTPKRDLEPEISFKKLSVIVPCFNEEATIVQIVDRIIKTNLTNIDIQIIVVNDGSNDNTEKLLIPYSKNDLITYIHL